MIHQAGAKLFYLPSYSPDLNSTEKLWAKVKAFLRKRRALTPEALQRRDRLRLPVLHLLIAETGLHMSKNFNFHKLIFQPPRITFCAGVVSFCRRTSKTSYNAQ